MLIISGGNVASHIQNISTAIGHSSNIQIFWLRLS